MPARLQRTSGFTLLELLVVIAIIGIVAALLVSVARSAKETGQATACLSNLRQLAAANLAYAGEHNGQYCFAQDAANNTRWHGERSGAGDRFDGTRGPLAPYLGKESRVKLCPALRDVLEGAESFEEGTGGYGYNAVYIGGTPGDYFTPERMANVARSSLTVMFTDTAFARAEGVQEYAYSEPWQWVDRRGRLRGKLSASVHFRHHGRANVAWCDGHVTAESPSKVDSTNGYGGNAGKWRLGWFGPSEENGYWNPHRSYATKGEESDEGRNRVSTTNRSGDPARKGSPDPLGTIEDKGYWDPTRSSTAAPR